MGKHVSSGAHHNPYDDALRRVKRGRHLLQIGRPDDAQSVLREAAAMVAAFEPPGDRFHPRTPTAAQAHHYDGAKLINAQGVMIGELEHIRTTGELTTDAVIELGGVRDVMGIGFIDLGGARHTIPTAKLVFGKPRGLGGTFVLLPTLSGPRRAERAIASAR